MAVKISSKPKMEHITVDDIWICIRVPLSDHRENVRKKLRKSGISDEDSKQILSLIHQFNVDMTQKIANTLSGVYVKVMHNE